MSKTSHGRKLSVVGLGYVGLPVAAAFAAAGNELVAFDISARRIDELRKGHDRTGEIDADTLKKARLDFTTDPADLKRADFHIVTVPTPITTARLPDLEPLRSASVSVGRALKKGDVVVYESTVYPGATEDDCVPILEAESGLKFGKDFTVGYSPERINPGDKAHRFETITKVVSGSDAATLDTVAAVYGSVVEAGIHRAPSIKVAEAAKVLENTQRDLNIALMNELALICDRIGIRTKDVLEAASTKWNFLKFFPGLVGGHCVGVDPYYLTAKAEAVGYHPEVILAGRRTNDGMGAYVAQRIVKLLIEQGHPVRGAKIGVLGVTFKEDVPDLRNSRAFDIIAELKAYGVEPLIHDPMADPEEARHEYGVSFAELSAFGNLHALLLVVPHRAYLDAGKFDAARYLAPNGVFADVKSACKPGDVPASIRYWSL